MECLECRKTMEEKEEEILGTLLKVYMCPKCGKKLIDREKLLESRGVPA